MCMYSARLQLLLSPEQRRRLEAESRRSRRSVNAIVREAIEARYGAPPREDRLDAARRIGEMRAEHLDPDDLRRLIDQRFDREVPSPARGTRRRPARGD